MPLISNDVFWRFVEEGESYNKTGFVVVRKLLVQPNTDRNYNTNVQFTEYQIRQRAWNFGEIESIEMLPDNKSAHVLFVNDCGANCMQVQHDFDRIMKRKQPFTIRPADSWKQPSAEMILPPECEQTSEIFWLNGDCLRHLSKYLDIDTLVNLADTCQKFDSLLKIHCFPNIRKFVFDPEYPGMHVNQNQVSKLLAKMNRTSQCIGKYITDLRFAGYIETDPTGYEDGIGKSVFKCDLSNRLLEVLVGNIGANIRRAEIDFAFIVSISTIAPILPHLEVLQLFGSSSKRSKIIDLQRMCPNLVDFAQCANVKMSICKETWKSLRRLYVDASGATPVHVLQSYFEKNPQLKCVTFTRDYSSVDLSLAVSHLPNLEKIAIQMDSNRRELSDRDISSMRNHQNLAEIDISGMHLDDLENLFNNLATLVGLRKIKLSVLGMRNESEDEQSHEQSFIKLVKSLPKLEYLDIYNMPITKANFIKFVGFAGQLKTLSYCNGINFTDDLMFKLVDVLRCNRHAGDALVLELHPLDLVKLTVVENESVLPYLQIKSCFP